MSLLSTAPRSHADTQLKEVLQTYQRRVATTPPGICPLAVELSLLQAAAAQTCGKCTPCRDGLPQLVTLLESVLACTAEPEAIERIKELATMVQSTSDCAIGYEAARSLLEGMTLFASEYESHVSAKTCTQGIEQTLPCETLCPAHANIPAYIALVGEGDYAGAVNMIRKDNPFPTACAFVCEHPCEEACRRTIIDAPLNIRGIKRFAVDNAAVDTVPLPPQNPASGRTVAVIGGGPSGLTCAYFLARMGHAVKVYEARGELGGMLRYGIPAYRFPRERLDEDIKGILALDGIEVMCNTLVDEEMMESITAAHDAVYVAIGAHTGKVLDIPGRESEGVFSAVDLLGRIGDGEYPNFSGKKVVVIGGGNVAMDCARTAIRAGGEEVSIVYRRRKEEMTALAAEVEGAVAEGVEMIVLQAPLAIESNEQGHCTALITQPQMIGNIQRGRPAPVAANKPTERIAADIVLIAVGQDVVTAPFEAAGMQSKRGTFVSDTHLRAEGLSKVFVGGDCQTGPATAIKAIGAGKVAARNIDEFLGYHHTLAWDIATPEPRPNLRTPMGRVDLIERPARERKHDFLDVEHGMSAEEVAQECSRCLRCDHFGCGAQEGGRDQYA